MSTTASSAIVLIAHGARDPDWRQPFEAIKARIEQRLPGARVALAFLEFMAPPLDAAVDALVDEGAQRIVVIPVFMAQGGHVKRDVPLILDALRARHPGVTILLAPAVGEADAVLDAIASWAIGLAQQTPP